MSQATDGHLQTKGRPGIGWDLIGLLLVTGSVFFVNLGGARLWDRDEPRNAGCAVEMLQRGDWVTPMFNDELRGQKPVLTYWLMMSAISAFGVNEFAVRFWSATLGVGTVLLTYLWVRHLLFPSMARWAALILSTSLMFTMASRAATPDAPLIFCMSLSITAYVLLTFKPSNVSNWNEVLALGRAERLRRPGYWFPTSAGALLVYAAMALGVLAKGPVAFVLPTIIIGLFVLIESSADEFYSGSNEKRRHRQGLSWLLHRTATAVHPGRFFQAVWQMQPWWLVLMVALISAPWFVWVGLRTEGEFLQLFFFREHFERATSAMEGHSGGWWFYPLAILVGVFPWSIVAVPALLVWRSLAKPVTLDSSRKAESSDDIGENNCGQWSSAWTLASVWIGLQVAVFSLASTKLPSYVTPCYPAVALLLAMVPTQLSQASWTMRPFWLRAGFASWILAGIALSSVLVYVFVSTMNWNVGWLPTIGGVLILGGVVTWCLYERQQLRMVSHSMFFTSLLFAVLTFGYATQYVSQFRSTDDLWQIARQHQRDGAVLAGYRDLESTWIYYAGQPIWELLPPAQAITDSPNDASLSSTARSPATPGLDDPFVREHDWQVKPRATVAQLLQYRPGSVIVTPEKHLDELLAQLPTGYIVLDKRPDFLTRHQLVLVGPRDARTELEEEPLRSANTLGDPKPR
ncbi:MAG: glycosyltransferase family 39 protein [Pirellulaceae bacterium]|nr:glycosyltransferase family 39 protein [Pirellulaceae bacterium]